MLILSRKPGEEIVIGEDIRLTVVSIHGNRVRLGFRAPPETTICRRELYDSLAASQKGTAPAADAQRPAKPSP